MDFVAQRQPQSFRIKTAPSKSSISYQNGKRDADLFKDLYFILLEHLGQHTETKRVLKK